MKEKDQYNKLSNKEDNNSQNKSENQQDKNSLTDGINLDYDYNSEYGDGDIPDIDK